LAVLEGGFYDGVHITKVIRVRLCQ